MLRNTFLLVCALTVFMEPPSASAATLVVYGSGALAQVVAGGPWKTTITLVNMDGFTADYEINFNGDDGTPMNLKTTAGQGSSFSGTLPPRGSTIIETVDGNPASSQGWAKVELKNPNSRIAASAVFRLIRPGSSNVEVALPLETGQGLGLNQRFTLPFDHVTATTGVAVVNPHSNTTITISFLFRDQLGQIVDTETFDLPPLNHRAFMLPEIFPRSANKQGAVEITGTSSFYLMGLRATTDTLTSITPFITQ